MRKAHHRQRGTSLIEALVALLVLALGVMGMAAVQTRTLATARTTNLRAVAIRASPAAALLARARTPWPGSAARTASTS